MRALSIREMDWVAGGWSSEEPPTEVVITGKRNPNTIYASEVIMPVKMETQPNLPKAPAVGADPVMSAEAKFQLQVVAAAKEAQDKILADPNHKKQEDFVFLYVDANGNVVSSQVIYNVDGNDANNNQAQVNQLGAQIGWDKIVGMVHNHDVQEYGDNPFENQMPSASDHNTAVKIDQLNGARSFTSYIIDTTDKMRGYTTSNDTRATPVIR